MTYVGSAGVGFGFVLRVPVRCGRGRDSARVVCGQDVLHALVLGSTCGRRRNSEHGRPSRGRDTRAFRQTERESECGRGGAGASVVVVR